MLINTTKKASVKLFNLNINSTNAAYIVSVSTEAVVKYNSYKFVCVVKDNAFIIMN